MKSVTDIIPEEFMEPGKIGDVITFLKAAPMESNEKVRALISWAHAVGAKTSSSQRAAVAASGTDYA
jgi:3-deoxy-D-arabino-heptulosonate 7-phosphate (DAHP) synthase